MTVVIEVPRTTEQPTETPRAPQPLTPVEREAARLDRLYPGWYENINTETLDLTYCDSCVLGQGVPHLDYGDAYYRVKGDGYSSHQCLYADNKWRPDWIAVIKQRRQR